MARYFPTAAVEHEEWSGQTGLLFTGAFLRSVWGRDRDTKIEIMTSNTRRGFLATDNVRITPWLPVWQTIARTSYQTSQRVVAETVAGRCGSAPARNMWGAERSR